MSFELAMWPGWPFAFAAVVTFLGWLFWRAVRRPPSIRWSDHRSALHEFNRTGGRR